MSTGRPAPSLDSVTGRLIALGGLPLLLILVLPLASLLGEFNAADFLAELRDPGTREAIYLSLKTSLLATLIVTMLGLPIAHWLARHRGPLAKALETVIELPTVLPPAVAGIALLLAFGRRGVVGSWLDAHGFSIAFTPTAVVIAQVFISAPYLIRPATVGLAMVSRDIQEAAALDGASWFQSLRYITLPVARRALFSGVMLAWARAMGEFGATIMFAGNMEGRTQTMPLAVYVGFETNLDRALTLSLIMLVFAALVLLLTRFFVAASTETESTP